MTAAAIRAAYSDWRPVKSRKVLQLVFEVPLERQTEVLTMLGAPMPDREIWCGIALLRDPAHAPVPVSGPPQESPGIPQARANPPPAGVSAIRSAQGRERYHNASDAQKAVIRAVRLPKDPEFRHWADVRDEENAIRFIRDRIGGSRSLIDEDPQVYDRFIQMETEYRIAVNRMANPR